MTSSEALASLLPIVGSGGLASVLVAYLGYKAQAAKGRVDTGPAIAAITSGMACKSVDYELMANAMTILAGAINRSNMLAEYRFHCAGKHDGFEDWKKERELAEVLAAFQADQRERARQARS